MSLTRRNFMFSLGAGLLLEQLQWLPALAQATGDYRALVCVFLFGGNDGNNTVIPIDSRYSSYMAVRGDGTNGGIGIAQGNLVPLTPASGSAGYGLHPNLLDLQSIWNSGQLAMLFNAGTLRQPMTVTEYKAGTKPAPLNLFSHADQQNQMQTAFSAGPIESGWAGRIADVLNGINGNSPLPLILSTGGNVLFTLGSQTHPLSLPSTGSFGLNSFGGTYSSGVSSAFQQLLALDRDNQQISAAQNTVTLGEAASTALSSILKGASGVDNAFSGLQTGIANQLHQVAKVIAANQSLSARRQVFFVQLGSFDTHTNQIKDQGNLFAELGPALKAFNDSMNQVGAGSQVTTFTLSDFARTFAPNSGGGTDHAWGNHHFIMGGAVKGRQFYGTYPALTLGGPDDVGREGRWLPTTSVDQYGATLARWFGVPDAALSTVFPNLTAFGSNNLGFMS